MIKGGFQGLDISGVDLTAQSPSLPGAYAACAAADGKPIRVLTAAGAVQCSVKKVSTNYVLAGITGDGKILSITVDSTDGISVNEAEIPEEAADEYLDRGVNIESYTSTNPYTAEYDGILKIDKSSTGALASNFQIIFKIGETQQNAAAILSILADAAVNTTASCFVKKGSVFYCQTNESGANAKFFPYKPVQS